MDNAPDSTVSGLSWPSGKNLKNFSENFKMKITRQKRVQRFLNFYKNNFGLREPYQFLLDGSFCNAALVKKVNLRDQLAKYLNGEVKILTTVCAVHEIQKLAPALYGAMVILKQFPVHKCGHEKAPVSVAECFISMVGESNANHYLVATQDKNLRNELRGIPGTPVLYMYHNAPLLEKPSEISEELAEDHNIARVLPTEFQRSTLQAMKEKLLDKDQETRRRRKRKGGPNPLSCKKKKKKPQAPRPDEKKRRKARFRLKMPKHVKEHLNNLQTN